MGALRKLKQEAGWASRGVQAHWHIPKYLLDKFAALLDFDIAHVRSAAERNLLRGNLAMMEHIAGKGLDPSEIDFAGSYRDRAQQMRAVAMAHAQRLVASEEVSMFPSGCIEYHMVADILEEAAGEVE